MHSQILNALFLSLAAATPSRPTALLRCTPHDAAGSTCTRLIFSVIAPSRGTYPSSLDCASSPRAAVVNGARIVSLDSLNLRAGVNVVEVAVAAALNFAEQCALNVVGALLPPRVGAAAAQFVELEAENATTTGALVGPSYTYTTLAAEASARMAIELVEGQHIDFVLPTAANLISIRYSVPDGSTATPLSVLVDGAISGSAMLTANWSYYYGAYPFTKNPSDGSPHHYFDSVDVWLSAPASAGSTLRLLHPGGQPRTPADTCTTVPDPQRVDCGFNGINETVCLSRECCWLPVDPNPGHLPWCFIPASHPPQPANGTITVDLIDAYAVDSPSAQPPSSISITDHGADPTGVADSTAAITATVAAALAAGVPAWVPPGRFTVTEHIFLPSNSTLLGAGPFFSILSGKGIGLFSAQGASFLHVGGLAIVGDTRIRDDSVADAGIGGGPSDSVFQDVHVSHTKCGAWVDGPLSGLVVIGARIIDTTADGVNFHRGVHNSVVAHSMVRNTGDDGLAMWAEDVPNENNTFARNTVQTPVLANNIAIYGGAGNQARDNLLLDTLTRGGGLHVGNRFNAAPLAGVTVLDGNELHRTGQFDPGFRFGVGAIWLYALDAPLTGALVVSNTRVLDSPCEAFQFIGSRVVNVTIINATVINVGTFVFQLQAPGSASATGVIAKGSQFAGVYDCSSGFDLVTDGGDAGFATTHCGFPPVAGLLV